MFIAELKMQKETEAVLSATLPALPLRDYEGMILGNALRMDWAEICAEGFDFIFGDPPFIGNSLQTEEQKADMLATIQDERGKPCKDSADGALSITEQV